jgi:hypothetical protein
MVIRCVCHESWILSWYLLIAPFVSSYYTFGILWVHLWYLVITPLVSSDYTFGVFWLHLWYLMITPLVSSDYTFDIFKLVLCIFDIIIIEILMILFYFPVTCWKAYLYNESQQILYRIKTNNHLSSQINEHQNKKKVMAKAHTAFGKVS